MFVHCCARQVKQILSEGVQGRVAQQSCTRQGCTRYSPGKHVAPKLPLLPPPTKGFGNVGSSEYAFPTCVSATQVQVNSTKRDGRHTPLLREAAIKFALTGSHLGGYPGLK